MTHTTFKLLVITFMILIVFNLFRGLYFLVTQKGDGKGTVRSLSWRIGLSVALFLVLVGLKLTGVVEPHALNEIRQPTSNDAPLEAEVEQTRDDSKSLEEIQQQAPHDGRIRLSPN